MAMDGGMSLFLNYVPVCTHPPHRSVLRLHGNISRVLGNRMSGHTTRGWRNIINLVSFINLAEYQFVINIQHPARKGPGETSGQSVTGSSAEGNDFVACGGGEIDAKALYKNKVFRSRVGI